MNPAVQAFLGLWVHMALADQATESGLDVCGRAPEAVVKVEMAEGGIEIVPPQQADDAAAEPDAFRIAGSAGQDAGSLGDFVDFLLAVFDGLFGRRLFGRGATTATLGERSACGQAEGQHGKRTQKSTQRHGLFVPFVLKTPLAPAPGISEAGLGRYCGYRAARRLFL
jgi:hypothetical protein